MTFHFWSLDFVYYPVSGIMWAWHKVFGSFMGYANPWAWVLSVVFLVFTLRILLFKPFLKQMDSQVKMQAIQPEMKKLREKYRDDKQRLNEEMMRLNKEAGVNPLASCLPMLMQAPVFIALYHVLKSFREHTDYVYFFGKNDVQSFLQAKLFGGAPLSSFMSMPELSNPAKGTVGLMELGGNRATVLAVAIPLSILAAIATHLTSRRSVARQKQVNPESATQGQAAIMNKLMLYVFPLGVLVFGIFFPIANLFYWLSNNSWTFGQLRFAHRVQDRKRDAELQIVQEAKVATTYSTPPPGARPQAGRKPAPGARPVRPVVEPRSTPTAKRGAPADGKPSGPQDSPAGPAAPGRVGSVPTSKRRTGTTAASATASANANGGVKRPRRPADTGTGGSLNGSAAASDHAVGQQQVAGTVNAAGEPQDSPRVSVTKPAGGTTGGTNGRTNGKRVVSPANGAANGTANVARATPASDVNGASKSAKIGTRPTESPKKPRR